MQPKQRITREMILERAFVMFCREGMEVINARSVAKALNCSTQPIFSYYSGMQELKTALDLKAQELFASEVAATPVSDTWLVDMYCAYVRFACAKPRVYEYLFKRACQENDRMTAFEPLYHALAEHVRQKEGLDQEKARTLCAEVAVYTEGLASVCMIRGKGCEDARERIVKAYQALRSSLA